MVEKVFDRAAFTASAEAIRARVVVNRRHDIPYVAGYSIDGFTIYIDRDLPATFQHDGQEVAIDEFLVVHEVTEKALLDSYGLTYKEAHAVAEYVDRSRILLDNVPLDAYLKHLSKHWKGDKLDRVRTLPADLDMTPYDQTSSPELLAHMRKLLAPPEPAAKKKVKPKGELTPLGRIALAVLANGGEVGAWDNSWHLNFNGAEAILKHTQADALVERRLVKVKESREDVGNNWKRGRKVLELTAKGHAEAGEIMDRMVLDGERLALLLSRMGPHDTVNEVLQTAVAHERHSMKIRGNIWGGFDVTVPAWELLIMGLLQADGNWRDREWHRTWHLTTKGLQAIKDHRRLGYGFREGEKGYELVTPADLPENFSEMAPDEQEAILNERRST